MRRLASNAFALLLIGLVAGLLLSPHEARAWWNDDWSLRKNIVIDTSAAGAGINDPIGTTPVLIRLHVGNFKFDAAKPDGSDLRVVAGDDKTPLKYHIEKYDGLLGEAFIWVNVPDLRPGAQTNIWIYYGNNKANASDDPKGTYDPDTVLVYHFGEHGLPARDVSSWGNNAQSAGLSEDGSLIGPGLRLDGQTLVTLPASPSLAWTDGGAMTWSAWINETALQPNAVLFSRHDGANALRIGVDNGVPFVEVSGSAGTQRSSAGTPIAAASWHHLAVVAGQQITLYVDGNPYATLNATLPALNTAATLGGDPVAAAAAPSSNAASAAPAGSATPSPSGTEPAGSAAAAAPTTPVAAAPLAASFVGELDELEISKVSRPAGFIRAAAIGQGADPGKFLTLGIDEETASWLSGYLAVILRSVTIDGWVVIGLLAIMAVISWIVMADKTAYVQRVARSNAQFLTKFRHVAKDLTILDRGDAANLAGIGGRLKEADAKMVRNSSLYRIYHVGVEEIRHRLGTDEQPRVLSTRSIEAIRASLDTGLVRETQRLNRLMVILTIAIAGGPFLGLLGTVIGVMITFASIAASGDVNVNAIAPGIAAALVATVAGLIVAIPALFGYNYLISRIRDATSDMQVFVDEFITKMAEFYRERADQPQTIAAE
jgi:biopolymer transport protein ExbB